jgi:hypothetical protein
LTSDTISGTSFIANFSGRLSNVTASTKKRLFVSGSAGYTSGSFSGSFNFVNNNFYANGLWTTGSFSGSVKTGTTFTKLNIGPRNFTISPLTASVTGTGSFKNLNGTIVGRSNTGIPCCKGFYRPVHAFLSGSFTGSFSGIISGSTSSSSYSDTARYAQTTFLLNYTPGISNGSSSYSS